MIQKLLVIFILSSIAHVSYADRIQGRKNGVEFNFPRFLTIKKDKISLSGTYSRFNHQKKTEIAFPWFVAKYGQGDKALTIKNIDLHYRQFLNDDLNGFYLSAFTRIGHIKGRVYKDDSSPTSTSLGGRYFEPDTEDYSKFRVGIGVGLGIRMFPENKRMYWGSGLIIGRYLDFNQPKFTYDSYYHSGGNNGGGTGPNPLNDTSSIIIDIELLKFGYAF